MVINLNKSFVTKDALLKRISDYEIYRMYMGDQLKARGKMKSPLREDNDPSFGLFTGESGELCFNDFVLGSGDCVKFVMLKFGLSFFEALSKIALDANLQDEFIIKNTFKTNFLASSTGPSREEFIKNVNSSYIGKTSRPWHIKDYAFWNQYGITKPILDRYNVIPIDYLHVGVNKSIIKSDFHTYCYNEMKDGKHTFKIYQPENTKFKWLNNHDDSVWQGWTQLPEKGDVVIITKSLKDVMAVVSATDYAAVSLQAESVYPKEQVIEELKSRFHYVFLLYDNDYDKPTNWGREFGRKLSDKFDICQIEIEEQYKSKDFSDLAKNHGQEVAKTCLENLTAIPF
jgi:hypothetical protein